MGTCGFRLLPRLPAPLSRARVSEPFVASRGPRVLQWSRVFSGLRANKDAYPGRVAADVPACGRRLDLLPAAPHFPNRGAAAFILCCAPRCESPNRAPVEGVLNAPLPPTGADATPGCELESRIWFARAFRVSPVEKLLPRYPPPLPPHRPQLGHHPRATKKCREGGGTAGGRGFARR